MSNAGTCSFSACGSYSGGGSDYGGYSGDGSACGEFYCGGSAYGGSPGSAGPCYSGNFGSEPACENDFMGGEECKYDNNQHDGEYNLGGNERSMSFLGNVHDDCEYRTGGNDASKDYDATFISTFINMAAKERTAAPGCPTTTPGSTDIPHMHTTPSSSSFNDGSLVFNSSTQPGLTRVLALSLMSNSCNSAQSGLELLSTGPENFWETERFRNYYKHSLGNRA